MSVRIVPASAQPLQFLAINRKVAERLIEGTEEHQFVMRASTIEYFAPARFDDLIEAFVRVSRIGRSSMTYECAAYRQPDDTLMVTARQTLVLVDLTERRPVEVPTELRAAIAQFEKDDLDA